MSNLENSTEKESSIDTMSMTYKASLSTGIYGTYQIAVTDTKQKDDRFDQYDDADYKLESDPLTWLSNKQTNKMMMMVIVI